MNGTIFYNKPDEIMDIAVRGMLNVIDLSANKVREFILFSSSEVYSNHQGYHAWKYGVKISDLYNPDIIEVNLLWIIIKISLWKRLW